MGENIWKERKKNKIIYFCGFAFLFFWIFLLLNFKMGYLLDDYIYQFIFKGMLIFENPVKVSSINDIYKGMITHYMIWGGRIPVHTMVQLLLLFDKSIFNICNSLITVLLGILVYFHANYGKKQSLWLFLAVNTMIWFFIPVAGYDMIYMTGTINYMWPCVYVLLFLIPFRVYLENEKSFKHSAVLFFIMIPFGFLAGWSNEPSGGAAGLFVLMLIIYLISKKRKPPIWMFSGIVSVAAGLAMLVLAPGYRTKAVQMHGASDLLSYSISNLAQHSKNVLQESFGSLWPLFLIIAVASILLFKLIKKNQKMLRNKKQAKKNIISPSSKPTAVFFFICAFAANAIYFVSPEFEPRYLFSAAVFLIISISSIFTELKKYIIFKKKIKTLAATMVIAFCCISIGIGAISEYHTCSFNNSVKIRIEDNIKSQVEKGQKNVILTGEYQFIDGGHFNVYRNGVFDLHVLFGGPDHDYASINKLLAATFGAKTYVNEATLSYVNPG